MEESFGIIPLRKNGGDFQLFLVQLKSGNHWGFPKGHRENPNESLKDIAKRELKEETNLEVIDFIDGFFEETYKLMRNSKETKKKVVYFPAFVKGDYHIQQNEIVDGGWFDLSAALERITYSQSKQITIELIEILKKLK